jgi:glucose-6-phosphate isomerase
MSSWQRFVAFSRHVPELGLTVDLSETSLADDALTSDALVTGAFPKAFADMAALEKGAVANPDENRMVGHYWLRAPELAPDPALRKAVEETTARVVDFAAKVHAGTIAPATADRFTNVLVVGIGGSALGPQFVADALRTRADRMTPFFFDNTDPDGMARELGKIAEHGGLARTLTVVISKSGGTKETRNGMLEAAAAYRIQGLEFARHAVAVTGDGSELDGVAVKEGWRDRFPMWDWVGGRTSELSAVGLLPAALQGIDVLEMLNGA